MLKIFFTIIITLTTLHADTNESSNLEEKQKNVWDSKNVWIKTYLNNKNYYTIINNIVKIEQKIKNKNNSSKELEKLKRRLEIQKSKLKLYERNKSFDTLLKDYDFSVDDVTAYDYFYEDSKNRLNKKIDKLIHLKNEFNKAYSLLNNHYKKNSSTVSSDDLKYFEEFLENINKTYLNLIESKDALEKKYEEYYQEKLQKHLITLAALIIIYLVYRVLLLIFTLLERRLKNDVNHIHRKIISIFFYTIILVALVVRYLEDFMYIITFLSVVAAALTIALREVILNIVASVYIFFSNMLRVGDRIMVQFETKHTIGDIKDISLMKIRLNEIEDYSNLKEIKNVGRTIYIPNSYVFTKVFYNYSRKKDALINGLIEFEFKSDNDFELIEKTTEEVFKELDIPYTLTFTLNNLKTGIIGLISYQANYKDVSRLRGEISIKLLQAYNANSEIKLKTSKGSSSSSKDEAEA
jgi:small-conductance mechanosensitive channel